MKSEELLYEVEHESKLMTPGEDGDYCSKIRTTYCRRVVFCNSSHRKDVP